MAIANSSAITPYVEWPVMTRKLLLALVLTILLATAAFSASITMQPLLSLLAILLLMSAISGSGYVLTRLLFLHWLVKDK